MKKVKTQVAIIGAGASGLMCAKQIASQGIGVLLIEGNQRAGMKILISGGGKCNFTNLSVKASDFLSSNPHFVKSALKGYSSQHFIDFIESNNIEYYHKGHGQLFCKNSAREILDLLLSEVHKNNVNIIYNTPDLVVTKRNDGFLLENKQIHIETHYLVVATGGLSYSKLGATDFGYRLAKEFGHKIIPPRPALVGMVVGGFSHLAGTSVLAQVKVNKAIFNENILFTHKGLSGPAVLKASLLWKNGLKIQINWLPNVEFEKLIQSKDKTLDRILKGQLPIKFFNHLCEMVEIDPRKKLCEISKKKLNKFKENLCHMDIIPQRVEGFHRAEATVGGVDTQNISSKTMESKLSHNLYFLGEVLDVTGQLGGFNFQWAWSSAVAAAKGIINKINNSPEESA